MSEQRLIDANAFLKTSIEEKKFIFSMKDTMNEQYVVRTVYKDLIDAVNKMQTVEPVKHGEWLNSSGFDDWYCSKCGFEINYDGNYPAEYDNFKYCGRCGAKMKGSIYGGREK